MRVLLLAIGLIVLISANLILADETANSGEYEIPKLKDEDWQPIHYQVYDSNGYYLQPDELLKLLKELQKVYEKFTDEETNGRKLRINNLIAASEMDPLKCNRPYMEWFDNLIKYNSVFKRTVTPYLTNHFIDFLSLCEDTALQHNVPRIEPEYQDEVKNLVRHIAMYHINGAAPGFEVISHLQGYLSHADKGILSYLQEKSGIMLDKEFLSSDDGKRKLERLFEEKVVRMCDKWWHATDPVDALKNYNVHIKVSDEERSWILYGRICRFIVEEQKKLLLKMSYGKLVKEKKEKEAKIGQFRRGLAKLG